jgi:hypothetical protein
MVSFSVPRTDFNLGGSSTYKVEDLYEIQYSRSLLLRLTPNGLNSAHVYLHVEPPSREALKLRFCKCENPISRVRRSLVNFLGEII